MMTLRGTSLLSVAAATVLAASAIREGRAADIPFEIAKIYWEYNASANDLGVHVSLDAEDWRRLKISKPGGRTIFDVEGRGAYRELGMTELFFEGAEPALDEFPLEDLLALFPEGVYEFSGTTVDGEEISGVDTFTHAIPDGPDVSAQISGDFLLISWSQVTSPPPGFPSADIDVVSYEVIVDPGFDVFVPGNVFSLTISPEFVHSLEPGEHPFEVLALEASGNQTLTEGTFVK